MVAYPLRAPGLLGRIRIDVGGQSRCRGRIVLRLRRCAGLVLKSLGLMARPQEAQFSGPYSVLLGFRHLGRWDQFHQPLYRELRELLQRFHQWVLRIDCGALLRRLVGLLLHSGNWLIASLQVHHITAFHSTKVHIAGRIHVKARLARGRGAPALRRVAEGDVVMIVFCGLVKTASGYFYVGCPVGALRIPAEQYVGSAVGFSARGFSR